MFRVVNAAQQESGIPESDLVALFDKLWSDFEAELAGLQNQSSAPTPKPDPVAIALETLEIVRGLRNTAQHAYVPIIANTIPDSRSITVVYPRTAKIDSQSVVHALTETGFVFVAQRTDANHHQLLFEWRGPGLTVGRVMRALRETFPSSTVHRYETNAGDLTYFIAAAPSGDQP